MDIAVIGLSFKLPQDVNDVSGFWDVLHNRRNLMAPWPASRMNTTSFVSGKGSKFSCRGGCFINEDPAGFDAPFFSISTKEAATLDPVQRWTLETAYHAFENAGIPAERLRGSRTAVFSACFTDDWSRMIAQDPDNVERSAATGTASSLIPNRVSWYFDLRGPSVHIDTACSSSLFAVDMACQSLQAGESTTALVTGSSLILTPTFTHFLSNLGFLSPDSKCWAFDQRANGYARGEGFTALVLKPLADALRDGDVIRGVIRATGSNQDGRTPSLTQPSPAAQEELIRRVYSKAGLSFDKTRYVEAHGTGTPVGDPIEMQAIGRVFQECRSAGDPLYVGSVKANIGHLEGSSGLAGMIKSIISLEKGIIPPHALFERINPAIDLDAYHIAIPTAEVAWPSSGVRRISVNSFGFGGTNTHVVLDDALHYLDEHGLVGYHCTVAGTQNGTQNGTNGTQNGTQNGTGKQVNGSSSQESTLRLLVWSAADEKAAQRTVAQEQAYYAAQVAGGPGSSRQRQQQLDRLVHTLSARRSRMLWRTWAVGSSSAEWRLRAAKPVRSSSSADDAGGLAFVFTGQGAQHADMGRGLAKRYPLFAETMQQMGAIYKGLGCEWDLETELEAAATDDERLGRPEYSQPLSTAVQVALVVLLRSFGVVPQAVVGHSSGEIAAAFAIGALSLESAAKVAYWRGRLAGRQQQRQQQEQKQAGAMVSINVAEAEVPAYLAKADAADVTVACINSPQNCTLSGPEGVIDRVRVQADRDGIFCVKLKTGGVAYHSPAMQAIADEYKQHMGALDGAGSSPITMVSTVTGQPVSPAVLATAQYWVANMVSPVRFVDAVRVLTDDSSSGKKITDLIEVGPAAALRRPVTDTVDGKAVRYASVLHKKRPAVETVLELAGELFARGRAVSIEAVNQLADGFQGPHLVDGPAYPFDHSHQYWAESRMSRDYRLRDAVVGDALGARAADWNPLQPRWRRFLSVESEPWLAGHNISDTVVYPAAGMLVMAMEAAAAHDAAGPSKRRIVSYRVQEAHFMNPIVVGATWPERTEVVVELQPVQAPDEKDATWSDVRIFSYRNQAWSACFRTRIQVQHEEDAQQPDAQQEQQLRDAGIVRRYEQAVQTTCTRPVDARVFYRRAADVGLRYGAEWFQLLEDVRWDGAATAVAQIDVAKAQFETASVVHPAVLDGLLHMLRASCQAFASTSAANMPVKLVDGWFAATGWQSPQTSHLRCWGGAQAEPDGGEDGALCALGDNGQVLASIAHLITVSVARSSDDSQTEKTLLHALEWQPQLSLLDPSQLAETCAQTTTTTVREDADIGLARHAELTAVMNRALVRALRGMTAMERKKIPTSLTRHVIWMEQHVRTLPDDGAEDDAPDDLESRLQAIETEHPPWALHTHVVRALGSILTGETDPLEVVFAANRADVFYADMFAQICDDRLRRFLALAAHEKPGQRILEVGAGTGGFTGHVLSTLLQLEKQTGGTRLAEYVYTDVSPTFFERARARWLEASSSSLADRMRFKTLDLERPLAKQGFEAGGYDLVVAGSVLHATADLKRTLRNVRAALKPGGKLLLLEVVAPDDVVVNFSFGLVPGWWRANEEWRAASPLLNEAQWDVCLRECGFSGNDLVLPDTDNGCHLCSILVSTAVAETTSTDTRTLFLVADKQQTARAEQIGSQVPLNSVVLSPEELLATEPAADDIVVCLVDLDTPFLSAMTEAKLAWLRHLARHAKKLLWLTATADSDASQAPFYGQAAGFFRTLRLEAVDSHIVTLAIPSKATDVQHIVKVLQASFLDTPASPEREYVVRNGLLETGRAIEDLEGNQTLRGLLVPQLHHQAWSAAPTALSLSVRTIGALDSLCFVEDAAHDTALAEGEVEIEARAWGVNFRDVLQALGRLPERTFGYDCAGVVTRVGPGVTDGPVAFRAGDRVCMVAPGCMRRFPRAPATSVIAIPSDSMSFATAAAVLVPGMTAYHALVHVARLDEGETVLIHSAAGSTGQMAVAVAKMCHGGKTDHIYATVGSPAKKSFLVNVLGVPADHVFHSRNTSFAQAVMRATGGRGVDVVLNSLAGDRLRASWECIAPGGRFVEIGQADIAANASLPMGAFARNVAFAAIDLRDLFLHRPRRTLELLRQTLQFVCDHDAAPAPIHVFPASQTEQAFRTLQNGTNIGRVVIEPGLADVVPQYLLQQLPWRFDNNASYLVAGGFGGVGRAILAWMADRGARHLIVPSRSGPASPAASQVVAALQARGVCVAAPVCDVASESALASALDASARTMPPIKGCIDAALVLQDAIFDNMTLAQWEGAVRAKVDTAWNLHRLLPRDLDFFVLLSSLAGVVGQMATANYAAGCAFQDALARVRVDQGQHAVSIDMGWMRDIGIVAETAAFQRQRLAADDMQQIDARELLALLALCCHPGASRPQPSQVLFGLRTPADFLRQGQAPPALLDAPLFAPFARVTGTASAAAAGSAAAQTADPAALFRAAASPQDKARVVVDALVGKLAHAMSIAPGDVEHTQPLSRYGVDSLMAVELRNWIRRDFAAPVAVFDIMGGRPIAAVGALVAARSAASAS